MRAWLKSLRVNWKAVGENLIADVIWWGIGLVFVLLIAVVGAFVALIRGNPSVAQVLFGAAAVLFLEFLIAIWLYSRQRRRQAVAGGGDAPEQGGELARTQAEVEETTPQPPEPAPAPPLPPDFAQRVREFVEAERARAAFWEYRFLNLYLVSHTQRVLDWFIGLGQRTTLQMYDTFWIEFLPDPNERVAVIGALRNYRLVEVREN